MEIYLVRRFDFGELSIEYYVEAESESDAALLGYYVTEEHNPFKKNADMDFDVKVSKLPYQYDGVVYTWFDVEFGHVEYRDFERAVLYLEDGSRLVFEGNEEARQYMESKGFNYDFYSTEVLKDSCLVGVLYGVWRREDFDYLRRNLYYSGSRGERWFLGR